MSDLGIVEVVDEHSPAHPLSRVSDGDCVAAMVLNILSGRMALFRMEEWLKRSDAQLLLGEHCEPSTFNDTRLAAALDHLDDVGTDTLMADVVGRYLERPDRQTVYSLHTDTTSFSLHGAYDAVTDPNVTFGYSKDKRPDLKQLIFGLTLHGAVGIPLVGSVTSGNTSDQAANRDHLAKLAKLLPDSDDITVVADCKLVDADTIGRVLGSGFHLVSLVPDTFALRRKLIEEAWAQQASIESWPELVRQRGRTAASPDKVYRGWSTTRPFSVLLRAGGDPASEPVESVEELRFLVVHSNRLASKFDDALPRRLKKERAQLERSQRRMARKGFACDGDARRAAEEVSKKVHYHEVTMTVSSEVRTLKRARQGRPRDNEPAPTEVRWVVSFDLVVDEAAVVRARQRASCFVLISDKLEGHYEFTDAQMLAEYRHQHLVENHCGFRWLKSEGEVSPMFLKTPRRIRAMGLVLVFALMVRNYIQFTLRKQLRERGETLPHPFTKKEVDNLTTEMAMAWFDDVVVVHAGIDDTGLVRQEPKLRPPALRILELLGVPREAFARPPPLLR